MRRKSHDFGALRPIIAITVISLFTQTLQFPPKVKLGLVFVSFFVLNTIDYQFTYL
jgi:hypothetical protein